MKTVLALCIGATIGAGIMQTIAAQIPAALATLSRGVA